MIRIYVKIPRFMPSFYYFCNMDMEVLRKCLEQIREERHNIPVVRIGYKSSRLITSQEQQFGF